jgi:hypothetical protein
MKAGTQSTSCLKFRGSPYFLCGVFWRNAGWNSTYFLSEVQGFNAILCGVFCLVEDWNSKYFSVPKGAGRLRGSSAFSRQTRRGSEGEV